MRKIALLFFVCVLFLTSCSSEPSDIITNFSATTKIEYNNVNIEGNIVTNKNNILTFTVTSPTSMEGYEYNYKNGELTINYGNLTVNAEQDYLPQYSFVKVLYNVLTSLSAENNCYLDSSDNALAWYKGSCNSGKYSIEAEYSTGVIHKITVDTIGFAAEFSNISITN